MLEKRTRGAYNPKESLGNGGYVKKNRWFLDMGSNAYRLLPPFGTMAETNNKLAKFWEVWWMPGSDGKRRPVPSILKTKGYGKNRETIQNDPIKDAVEKLKAGILKMKEAKQNPSIVEALEKKMKSFMNIRGFHLNVMKPTGEIGVLVIPSRSFQALKQRLDELEKEGVDPINFGTGNGIIFDFKKNKDEKNQYIHTVDISQKSYRDPATGRIVKSYEMLELDESTWDRMDKEAEDLNLMFKELTPEETAMIASLDPVAVDRIFAKPEKVDEDEDTVLDDESDDMEVGTPVTAAPVVAQVVAEVKAEPVKVDPPKIQKVEIATPVETIQQTVEDVDNVVAKFLNGDL